MSLEEVQKRIIADRLFDPPKIYHPSLLSTPAVEVDLTRQPQPKVSKVVIKAVGYVEKDQLTGQTLLVCQSPKQS